MTVQNFEPRNKKRSFAEELRQQILSGILKPGDRLPSERELAERAGISRSSVNQGILELERAGFLHIIPRKGTYVADYLQNATADTLAAILSHSSDRVDASLFKDLMGLRILIEKECARIASCRVNSKAIEGLSERTEALFRAEENLADVVYEFHRYVVQLSGNSAYTVVFRSFEKMLRRMMQLHYSSRKELQKSLHYYDAIFSAISHGEGDKAEKLMGELLYDASDYLDRILRSRED